MICLVAQAFLVLALDVSRPNVVRLYTLRPRVSGEGWADTRFGVHRLMSFSRKRQNFLTRGWTGGEEYPLTPFSIPPARRIYRAGGVLRWQKLKALGDHIETRKHTPSLGRRTGIKERCVGCSFRHRLYLVRIAHPCDQLLRARPTSHQKGKDPPRRVSEIVLFKILVWE